jgi:uncharacterized protein (DUF58 family)
MAAAERDYWVRAPLNERGTRWLAVAAGVALVAILLREPLLLTLAVVLLLVAAVARVWWRFGLSEVSYRRRFPARAFYGEEIELELVTENAKPLPLIWLEVVDEFPNRLEVVGTPLEPAGKPNIGLFRTFFSVRPYERVRRRYRLRCTARGFHHFGPARLTTGDPFGFSAREQSVERVDDLIVYPRLVPVTAFGLPARQPLGERKPAHLAIEDPLRVEGVRPYVAGDSPRRIHWRASARTGTLQAKRYEPTATETVALFLDGNTFEHFWEGIDPELLELAITVAASLAAHLLREGRPVGLFSNAPTSGNARFIRVAPGRHPAQLTRILEALAQMIPSTGARIEQTLTRETGTLAQGATIVVVTGHVTADLQRTLLRLLRSNRHVVLIACGEEPVLGAELRRRLPMYHVAGTEGWDALDRVALVR